MKHWDAVGLGGYDRVRLANEMALRFAMDAPLRKLAAVIVKDAWSVTVQGAPKIARWIRGAFQYTLEAPGVEILQGPYTSLKTRVADCDDATILWVTLTRSIGLQTYFCGVGRVSSPEVLLHAVGFDMVTGRLYELINDEPYSGCVAGLEFSLPEGFFAIYWSPEPGQQGFYWRQGSAPFSPVE